MKKFLEYIDGDKHPNVVLALFVLWIVVTCFMWNSVWHDVYSHI